MELQQIRYFLALAETGSFTGAARRCFVSQPSLSQQIAKLEGEMGEPLVHRMRHGNALTPAGVRFLEHARRILDEFDRALKSSTQANRQPRGRVSVGVIPSLAPGVVPQVIDRCRTLVPEVRIEVHESEVRELMTAMVDGGVELALTSGALADRRLQSTVLFAEPVYAVVRVGHALAALQAIPPEALARETLVLLAEDGGRHEPVEGSLAGLLDEHAVLHRVRQVDTVKAFVVAGLGVGLLPQCARSHRSDQQRRLLYRTLEGPGGRREVCLMQHRSRYQTPATSAVARVIQEAFPSPVRGSMDGADENLSNGDAR